MVSMFLNALLAPLALAATLATATVEAGEHVAMPMPDMSEITGPGPSTGRRAAQPQDFVTPPDMTEVTGGGVDLEGVMTPAAQEAMCAAAELDRNKENSGLQAIHGVCSKRGGAMKSVPGSAL